MRKLISAMHEMRMDETDTVTIKQEKFNELLIEESEIEDRLLNELSAEHRKIFERYIQIRTELESLPLEREYEYGFKDGLKMMLYAVSEDKE